MSLTLSGIRMFVAVVEDGSLTAAARRLNTTQSGISQQIRKLEQRYGATLLNRSRAGATPTPAGERLYHHGVAMLREAAAAEQALRAAGSQGMEGEARVGLMSAMTRCFMGPALRDFQARNLNAQVRIVEDVSNALVDRVVKDTLDTAIVPVLAVPRSVASRFLGETPEVHVSRRSDPGTHLAPLDLARAPVQRIILPEPGNLRRERILAWLAARGVTPEQEISLGSMFGTLEFIRNSDHAAILPAIMVLPEIASGELCVRPLGREPLSLGLMAISPRRLAPSPVADAFIDRLALELARVHEALPPAMFR